jgi:hypothetical protein
MRQVYKWEWLRDRWVYRIPYRDDNYIAGTVRPYNNGQFYWELYENSYTKPKIEHKTGISYSREIAEKEIEKYYKIL